MNFRVLIEKKKIHCTPIVSPVHSFSLYLGVPAICEFGFACCGLVNFNANQID